MNITQVSPSAVPRIWPQVEALLQPAIDRASDVLSPDDVLKGLCVGQQRLWLVYEDKVLKAALVAEVFDRPKARVCALLYVGGEDMDQWFDMARQTITAWARPQGCKVFEALVRPGLAKKLRSQAREIGTVMRMNIDG